MTLQILWFILWGTLWTVYFILDGFSLGIGILYPFVAKNHSERKIFINSIGPIWNGNEVWLITAGGATFAAFPAAYGILFSYFYLAMFFLLFSLILRGISIELHSKVTSKLGIFFCNSAFFIGSLLVTLLLGIFWGNIFVGLPILGNEYESSFLSNISLYTLLVGLLFILFFIFHGAIYLLLKTDGELQTRIFKLTKKIWYFLFTFSLAFLISSLFTSKLYHKYIANPFLLVIPVVFIIALILARINLKDLGSVKVSFMFSSSTILFFMATVLVGLFPNLVPSTLDPMYSVTIYNSSSSPYTLKIMTYVALIFVPIVIIYQAWIYKIFAFKVTDKDNY